MESGRAKAPEVLKSADILSIAKVLVKVNFIQELRSDVRTPLLRNLKQTFWPQHRNISYF
jgi:hypothetical protein